MYKINEEKMYSNYSTSFTVEANKENYLTVNEDVLRTTNIFISVK